MITKRFVETATGPLRLKGLPLQQRLPLLICILLLLIMVTFSLISYQGIKKATLTSGKERLLSLTTQLGTMFSQSMQVVLTATKTSANQPILRRFIVGGGAGQKDSALLVLQKIQQDSTTVLVEILDSNYQLRLRLAKDSIHKWVNFDSLTVQLRNRRDTAIGKIVAIRDSMYYPVIAAVSEKKQVIGYLVRWRLLSATRQTIEQLSLLMGTRSTLYIGNADGSLWTDMIKPVDHFLDTAQLNKPVERKESGDHSIISATKVITNTPWLVSVEFPRQVILESANKFLRWMIVAGLILLAVGILVAWLISRSIINPLNRLTAATSGIASGNYLPSAGAERRDEVGKLARAFNTMIEQVGQARKSLEQKVIESGKMTEQLRNLTAHLQNIREEERIHIAREMHDELGQLLTAFKMDVSGLQKKLAVSPDEALRQKLKDMSKLIDDSVVFVRKIASELRPSVLDDFGLIPALQWHSEEFEKRFNIPVEFHSNTKELKTSSVIATGLFRMYQESLTNVARHADATKVSTRLQVSEEQVQLTVQDNGKGFDLKGQSQKQTLGLLGMKERAAMIGGKLEIISAPGKGTRVNIKVPLSVEY